MKKTIISKIEVKEKFIKTVKMAVKIMKRGGLIIYPTETCYGIGCDATNSKAIKKIYKIKKREKKKAMTILVSNRRMIKKYVKVTKKIEKLMKNFMPGPLTIIAKKRNDNFLVNRENTVAFRVSSNKLATNIVKNLKKPIISTSANISKESPIYNIKEIIKTFDKKVDMIIDGGNLKKIKPSTIIDMTNNEDIIRKGPISREEILKSLSKG